MTDAADPTGTDPDVAAAELVLGLIEGDERAAALRRMLADPAFARDVERWRLYFGVLFAAVPSIEPSAALGERVIVRLDGPARNQANPWKPFAIAASVAAAGLLGVTLYRPEPALPPPVTITAPAPMVAAFVIEGIERPLIATYDSAKGTLSLPGPIPIPAGRSAQLWAIVGSDAPRPLGLLREAGARVEADARSATPIAPGTTLAISIEPLGGSPTGAPTGPVVGSGTLVRT